MITYKGEELENFLNRTKNPYLKEYRREFHSHPFRVLFRETTNRIKLKCLFILCGSNIRTSYTRRNNLDKKLIIDILNKYRISRRIREHQHKSIPLLLNNKLIVIDKSMALAIYSLNNMGIKTRFCCEGHMDEYDGGSCAYISLEKNNKFPMDIFKILEKKDVKYNFYTQEKGGDFGERLYSQNSKEFNKPFVQALNEWARKNNDISDKELIQIWKNK